MSSQPSAPGDAPGAAAPGASTLVADGYDRAARRFATSADSLVYGRLARPLALAIVSVAGPLRGPVLDVAAGSGALGRSLSEPGPLGEVALDVSRCQLAQNRARRAVLGDGVALPFRSDSFAVAASAFGLNHMARPDRAVDEMARVAPVVGISTWTRPEPDYGPKRVVLAALERQLGTSRTAVGELVDRIGGAIGSVAAISGLLAGAGLAQRVATIEVEVPWIGVDSYLDYRLGMPSTPEPTDRRRLRAEVVGELAGLSADELVWRASVVVGVGWRAGQV